MSIADNFTVVVVNEPSNKPDGDLAPHYAMKVALESLRDRCTKLQSRISHLEEENLQLKISSCKDKYPDKNKCENNLNSINTNEELNGNLWVKVSRKDKVRNQENSNKTRSSSKGSNNSSMSDPIGSSVLKTDALKVKEDSLEEISLQGEIYSSKDKNDVEVEEENDYEEDNLESLDTALKEILKKMKRDQQVIKQQQEGLKTALQLFKKLIKDKSICKTCLMREEHVKGKENKIVGTGDSIVGRSEVEGFRPRERIRVPIPTTDDTPPLQLKDRICPLCEKYFHCSTPFDTFNEHVLSHFVEEEEDGDNLSNKYEVIT